MNPGGGGVLIRQAAYAEVPMRLFGGPHVTDISWEIPDCGVLGGRDIDWRV